MPNAVLRACAKVCSEKQWNEIKKEMNRRKGKLQKPNEFGKDLSVNDVYFIAKKLHKLKKIEFRKVANYVQMELNKWVVITN